jgi:hypothetical protein
MIEDTMNTTAFVKASAKLLEEQHNLAFTHSPSERATRRSERRWHALLPLDGPSTLPLQPRCCTSIAAPPSDPSFPASRRFATNRPHMPYYRAKKSA